MDTDGNDDDDVVDDIKSETRHKQKKRKIRNNGNTNVGLTIPKTLLHTLNSMAN